MGLQELQLLVSDAVQLHEEEGKLLAAAIQMTLQSEIGTCLFVIMSGSSYTDNGSTARSLRKQAAEVAEMCALLHSSSLAVKMHSPTSCTALDVPAGSSRTQQHS